MNLNPFEFLFGKLVDFVFILWDIRADHQQRKASILEAIRGTREGSDQVQIDSDKKGLLLAIKGDVHYIAKTVKKRFILTEQELARYEKGGLRALHSIARRK